MKFKLIPILVLVAVTSSFAQQLKLVHEIKSQSSSISDAFFASNMLPNGELSIIAMNGRKSNFLNGSHTIITKDNSVLTLPEIPCKLLGSMPLEYLAEQTSKPALKYSFSDKTSIYQFSITPQNNLKLLRINLNQPHSIDSIISINGISEAIASVQKDFKSLNYLEILNLHADDNRALMYIQTEVSYGSNKVGFYRYALIFDYSSRLISSIASETLDLNTIDECKNRNIIAICKNNFISAQPSIVKKEKNKDIYHTEWNLTAYNSETKTSKKITLSAKTTDPILVASNENPFDKNACGLRSSITFDELNDYIYVDNLCFNRVDDNIVSLSLHKFNFEGEEIWKQKLVFDQDKMTRSHGEKHGIASEGKILRDGNLSLKITPFYANSEFSVEDTRHSIYVFNAKSGSFLNKTEFTKFKQIMSTYPDKEIDETMMLAIQNLMKQDKTLEFCDEKRPNNSIYKVGINDYFVILKSKKNDVYKVYRYQ